MKKIALFVSILALAMCASAQTLIDFTNLTATATPAAVPEEYAGLNWTGIDFVDPLQWSYTNGTIEVGAGFTSGPEALVAFGGGPLRGSACSAGSLSHSCPRPPSNRRESLY